MDFRSTFALAAALALGGDVSGLVPFRSAPPSVNEFSFLSLTTLPTLPIAAPSQAGADAHGADQPSKTLQPQSRLLLIRYVDGEFAKLMLGLPGGTKGLKIEAGKPVDPQHLADMLRLYGTAASQGDTVQITAVDFRPSQIVLEINGGGKKHFHLRDHLQVGVGSMPDDPAPTTGTTQLGGVLILDYGHPLPDMSPDDLKHDLAVMLDFSKQQSPTVNWVDMLPP